MPRQFSITLPADSRESVETARAYLEGQRGQVSKAAAIRQSVHWIAAMIRAGADPQTVVDSATREGQRTGVGG